MAQLEGEPEGAADRPQRDPCLRIAACLKPPQGSGRNAERALPRNLGAEGGAGPTGRTRGVVEDRTADQSGADGSLRAAEIFTNKMTLRWSN